MRLSIAITFWLLSVGAAQAADFDYAAFSRLPVQDEGRLKPLNSFATSYLERFTGAARLKDKPAIAWLADSMFDPATAISAPVFLLKDAEAQAMLGLPQKPDNLYSFAEATAAIQTNSALIQSLLQRPEKELSAGQKAALDIYANTEQFLQIMFSSTLFLQLSIDLPEKVVTHLGIAPDARSFMDYYRYLPELQKILDAVVVRKGSDSSTYTDAEVRLAEAVGRIAMTIESSHDNTLLRIIPPSWGGDTWLSPWAVFHEGQGSPQTAETMRLWRNLATAYQAHDAAKWQEVSQALLTQSYQTPSVRPYALTLEMLYYRIDPLGKALGLYALGFVLTLLGISLWRFGYVFAMYATGAGALLHIAGIAARVIILERPPVGTLYESLLFVSLIAVLFGLYLERRLRNTLGLLIATLAGSVLLFVSGGFAEGDTMGMLVAVLNTNFWLATHVLSITSGYGFGIAAAIGAHVYLIMRCAHREADRARQVLRGAYATALIALLFTALGTILGGIWADQSWGRFWGWDPKENGALLICLWLIWTLHGRISLQLRERGFAIALALLNVVIALSWLGVNLLATGLHSYGFTNKAALALGSFCAVEVIFAAFAYVTLGKREYAA